MISENYDAIVIGSGPAGQNAAITAANCGARTLLVEREHKSGGACLQYGTIPSKTLRETAVCLSSFCRRNGGVYEISQRDDLQLDSLMARLHHVVDAHQQTTQRYLDSADVERTHGHAEFLSPTSLSVLHNDGSRKVVNGNRIFIATGSRPRSLPHIPVDHHHILDSDSILSMTYLPRSLTIIGGGVIACEYASTFACLNVAVRMVDRYPTPIGFLDSDLVEGFVEQFRAYGGEFIGNKKITEVKWDGVSQVRTTCECGETVESEKVLVALGRVANTDNLGLENTEVEITDSGHVAVNQHFLTNSPSIYAIGDAVGPPALASTALHQGRSAALHAFGQAQSADEESLPPMGIYTIPQISSIGMTEREAEKTGLAIVSGRADFLDLARGQIMAANGGFLKLISDSEGKKLLGVQILGEGATELIHVGQVVLAADMTIDQLATTNFNFPTLAEAYRLAALRIIEQRNSKTTVCGIGRNQEHNVAVAT